ncbi:MAG: hypothetical protein J0H74_22515 [Chitinophagaceae bacterium]|nr:hypothetical protein [Chitinophagaceae bacterium]
MTASKLLFLVLFIVSGVRTWAQQRLQVSGVYPHLATFNEGGSNKCVIGGKSGDGGEDGIGAVVPWAGKLWLITYSPHCPNGSADKLYSIDSNLNLIIHKESVGGTPANRLIHKESMQLLIGPYLIDTNAGIRVIPPSVMPGRLTATARHLTDPVNMVYYYDMEGKVYEANVHTLEVKKLFEKPVPGWHGKGAYTAQHRLVVANNGEDAIFRITREMLQAGDIPRNPEEKGVLASWDGKTWQIIRRRQFTDVTGPGGIYGAPADNSPLWSIGWDKRSVLLELLDGGRWYTYRLPKAAHTYDHWGGWYTEWPRIREVGNGRMLMDMHAMFYDFPSTFSYTNSGGVMPIGSHLRYIPDFCNWNGRLVLSTDETTILENPMAGRAQSNLWFGQWDDLKTWGAASGWGGPWMNDSIKAGIASDAFLINGFDKRIVHVSHNADGPVAFTLEVDKKGDNHWETYKILTVGSHGYAYYIFPKEFTANWVRVRTNKDCKASVFFHFEGAASPVAPGMFESIAGIDDRDSLHRQLIRPAASPDKNLQVLSLSREKKYEEVNEKLEFLNNVSDSGVVVEKILALQKHYAIDEASVIVQDATGTFRLPMTSRNYETFPYRDKRELESERFMLNIQGTLYEVGRESGFAAIRPVTTHKKKIIDLCTWRGLLVISGTKINAKPDGHYFQNPDGTNGLWFGAIDDLWKMGKPVGEGGVWKNTAVKARASSLPYLMTGYDKKKITLTADRDVNFTIEVNTDLDGWHSYKNIFVKAGKSVEHIFPDGYNAHWVRVTADKDCMATAWLKYE